MTPLIANYLDALERLSLSKGNHVSFEQGVCAMEAVAYISGEPHSDHPKCASRTITAFLITWNDALPSDADRNRVIRPLLPLVVDTTAGKAIELRRSYMALDWLLRECAPTFLALTPKLADCAKTLRTLPEATDAMTAKQFVVPLTAARDAAWAAARDAAGAAARDAAGAAAWDAAAAAAGVAAWDAAAAAAGVAAGAA